MLSSLARVLSFGRQGAPFVTSELMSSDIAQYYQRIVIDCLRRMLVPPSAVEVEIRAGVSDGGPQLYAAYIRLLRWDSGLAPVLLQNLPVLDGRIRAMAEASVLLEHTRFGGVWMQAVSTIPGAPNALAGRPAELIRQAAAQPAR